MSKHVSQSTTSAQERWEYLYINAESWRERVSNRVGYRWKFLWTRQKRKDFVQECQRAIQEELAELGEDGWELVAIIPLTLLGWSVGIEAIFKRRRSESYHGTLGESEQLCDTVSAN